MAIAPLHPSPPLAAADGVRQVHAVLDRCASVAELSGYAASSLIGLGKPLGGPAWPAMPFRSTREIDLEGRRIVAGTHPARHQHVVRTVGHDVLYPRVWEAD